jgi:hypothetical protein
MARIITPEAIASYPNIFHPQPVSAEDAAQGKKPKYGVALVFPADADLKSLKQTAIKAAQDRWGDKLKGAKMVTLETQHGPATFLQAGKLRVRLPWRDQEDVIADKGYPAGSTLINVRSDRKPGVVNTIPDPNNGGKPTVVTDEAAIYPGVIIRASLSAFTYDNSGNSGVTYGLENVQIVRDGDRLDGGANATDEFAADENAVADLSDLEDTPAGVGAEADTGDDLSDLMG